MGRSLHLAPFAIIALFCVLVAVEKAAAESRHTAGPSTLAGDEHISTAGEALDLLRSGNARFAHDAARHLHLDHARRRATASAQHPVAAILACSDSRVPVEEIFDEGVGDVFVVRVAGNVCGTDEIGSLEYAAVHLHTPLIIVLGHTSCGAVTAAASGEPAHGCIASLLEQIRPAVGEAQRAHPELHGTALVPEAIRKNVCRSMANLILKSSDLRERLSSGEMTLVGAIYHLDSGEVEWLGPHRRQRALLAEGATRARSARAGVHVRQTASQPAAHR